MERLSIYFSRTHASVTVVDKDFVSREASSKSMVTTIANMRADDQDLLHDFCKSVVACIEHGDCKQLGEF